MGQFFYGRAMEMLLLFQCPEGRFGVYRTQRVCRFLIVACLYAASFYVYLR